MQEPKGTDDGALLVLPSENMSMGLVFSSVSSPAGGARVYVVALLVLRDIPDDFVYG